jgi:hypothetical protein
VYLVEFLLPTFDNDGRRFPRREFEVVRRELTDKFGGVTAFVKSPAVGLWADDGQVRRDELAVFEVMTETLDRDWWKDYREQLERRFGQDEIVMRALTFDRL